MSSSRRSHRDSNIGPSKPTRVESQTVIGFLLRRFRWVAVGAGVKFVARRGVGRSVDDAAAKIEDRLPAHVVKVANALPGDVVKAGGAAVVSARAARQSARAAKTGGLIVARVTKAGLQVSTQAASLRPGPAVAGRLRAARHSIVAQADADQRELRADFLRYRGDEEGATNALLDLRDERNDGPLPDVPDPVRPGRRRFIGVRRAAEVGRVQRTYRRPSKPWDRPIRAGHTPATADQNSGEHGTLDR